jgi:hypothetical protein
MLRPLLRKLDGKKPPRKSLLQLYMGVSIEDTFIKVIPMSHIELIDLFGIPRYIAPNAEYISEKCFGLSVLTEPQPQLPKIGRLIATAIRNRARYYLKGVISMDRKKFGGHDAVTRSLITGLSNINANFNYNPIETAEIHENVILLSGIGRLNDVLELKRKGIVKFLLVGPNIVDHVLDFDILWHIH